MGVFYLFGRDGKVFRPPRYWDGSPCRSADGKSGAQLNVPRLAVLVSVLIILCSLGFYLLEAEVECSREKSASVITALLAPATENCRRKVSILDSLYFTVVTFSTVGYGDFAPSSDLSRLLVFALALLAMGVFSTLLDLVGEWRVRIFDKMPQERQILAVLAAQIGGGAAVLAAVDGLSLQDSMLLALQTVSTVGYGELRPRSELGKVVTMGLVLSSVSTFGWVTSCIGDAIHPDSDTSIGLGGTVGHWGFSSIDRFLGRAHGKTAASFSLSSSSEHRAMLLVKAAVLLFFSAVAASAANGLPLLDAFYWTVMTVSTVGYGDVTLSSWGKWIEIFLLVFGLGLFSSFTDIAAETLRRPLERNFGNSARPPALLAGILVVQAVAFSVVEEIPLPDGLYLALCTISTIGYGDIHPRSALGKLLACAFTIASVSIAGATLSAIGDHLQDLLCIQPWTDESDEVTGRPPSCGVAKQQEEKAGPRSPRGLKRKKQ